MGAKLALVSNRGHSVEAPAPGSLPIETGSDPRAIAFVKTMELALRQAQRLTERSEEQPARLRKLARAIQDQSREILALSEEDARWTVEPFVGA